MHGADLFLIRHGETSWNLERRFQGHRDSPLTGRGIEQDRHDAGSEVKGSVEIGALLYVLPVELDVTKGKDGVRAAVTGAGDDGVFRSKEIESALAKKFDATALDGVKIPSGSLMTDMHAGAEYRANLIAVMAKRAVSQANA